MPTDPLSSRLTNPSSRGSLLSMWMRPPPIIPATWTVERMPYPTQDPRDQWLTRTYPAGMLATFAEETYAPSEYDHPGHFRGAGTYRRIVFSRIDRIPSWEEMRDAIRASGLFDPDLDVVMILPPRREYVNIHRHAMHWFQFVRPWQGSATLRRIKAPSEVIARYEAEEEAERRIRAGSHD